MSRIVKCWDTLFLAERPSLGLSLFRFSVAFTVGAHVLPSLLYLEDNYLATAFKTTNPGFFPAPILELVARSPDSIVYAFAWLFLASLATFALGLYAQVSCILLTLACYYLYALNNYHIGTLSWDILLVVLFLMCLTKAHGDFLSLDSLRRGKADAYNRPRPFYIQRLLQLHLVMNFWHTALNKTHYLLHPTAPLQGNWITDNPYYYLMHYPAIGVVRDFPLREWLAQHPQLCYVIGLGVIVTELVVPILWFIPGLRVVGLAIGIAFVLLLWHTLHVPSIFWHLFPFMMLLFIPPETLVGWIERRQARSHLRRIGVLLYDGRCGFCLASIRRLRVLDVFQAIELRNFYELSDLTAIHPGLSAERLKSEMVLVEAHGAVSGGFEAFRRLCVKLPLLWLFVPLVFLPGAGWVGTRVYQWVAANRYLFHRNPTCSTNECGLGS